MCSSLKSRSSVVAILCYALLFALFGCRSVATSITQEIRLNLGLEPATIDPALATDPGAQQIGRMLFLSLVDTVAASGAPEHALAISWAVSRDGLIWEFKLRNDAVWVKYIPSLDRIDQMRPVDRAGCGLFCTAGFRSARWLRLRSPLCATGSWRAKNCWQQIRRKRAPPTFSASSIILGCKQSTIQPSALRSLAPPVISRASLADGSYERSRARRSTQEEMTGQSPGRFGRMAHSCWSAGRTIGRFF